jgi:hypothetical protein
VRRRTCATQCRSKQFIGNQFFYLFGAINQPRVIAVIDGRSKRTTLYLDRDRMERAYGVPSLAPGEPSAREAGGDAVEPRDSFASALAQIAAEKRTIDMTRIFPANGKFTRTQREAYTIYLRLYQALMTSIKVHTAPRDIIKAAVVKMDSIVGAYKFTNPSIKAAATAFVDRYRNSRSNSLGHTVGMEVHDVRNPTETLEPGEIFTIEPQMNVPQEHFGIRLEDILLITEAGYENLSAFVPIEIPDIEKLMKDRGLSDAALKWPGRR